jgi:hypothetical protein
MIDTYCFLEFISEGQFMSQEGSVFKTMLLNNKWKVINGLVKQMRQ